MVNPACLNPMWIVHPPRRAAATGFITFAALTIAVLLSNLPDNPVDPAKPVIHDLGVELLGNSMLIFEPAGITLLATMVGTVILSSRSDRYCPADEGSLPTPLTPGGRHAGRVPEDEAGTSPPSPSSPTP